MSEDKCIAIKITRDIPFFGEGDSLASRLRNVTLRGFPNVKIYENARFELLFMRPEEIPQQLHTPQPNIYENNLGTVGQIARLFLEKGIDITNLERCYDFVARSESGVETKWTMIPPVVERWKIPRTGEGKFDYTPLIGKELREMLQKQNLDINPELSKLDYPSESGEFNLINDGAHRVYYGLMNKGVKVIRIEGMAQGYPYYAAPQKYATKIMPCADDKSTAMKIHVVQSPAQKLLYRSFPTGGIMTGEVRPPTEGETFI